MRTSVKTLIAASAIGAASIGAVQPAEARDHTGAAVVAGIIGLGVGAAIVSSSNNHRYDDGAAYYDAGYQPYGYGYGSPTVVYERSYGYDRPYYRDRGYWDHGDRGYRGHDRDYDRGRDWRR